jgi:hypothetical protein
MNDVGEDETFFLQKKIVDTSFFIFSFTIFILPFFVGAEPALVMQ